MKQIPTYFCSNSFTAHPSSFVLLLPDRAEPSEANHLDINLAAAAFRPLHLSFLARSVRARAMFSLVFEAAAAAAVLRDLPATGGIAVYSVFPSLSTPNPNPNSELFSSARLSISSFPHERRVRGRPPPAAGGV